MKKEEFDKLPDTEKQHYDHCPKCKEYFDLRDPAQVKKHTHGITSGIIIDIEPQVSEI